MRARLGLRNMWVCPGCVIGWRSRRGILGRPASPVKRTCLAGWHRAARRFVARNRQALQRVPVAFFCTAMSLTQPGEATWAGIPIAVDPKLAKAPKDPNRPSLRERYASVGGYLRPILKAGGSLQPVGVAFFGGKLDLMHLSLLPQLFVMLVVQARPGDLRNWSFIRGWATDLGSAWVKAGEA